MGDGAPPALAVVVEEPKTPSRSHEASALSPGGGLRSDARDRVEEALLQTEEMPPEDDGFDLGETDDIVGELLKPVLQEADLAVYEEGTG